MRAVNRSTMVPARRTCRDGPAAKHNRNARTAKPTNRDPKKPKPNNMHQHVRHPQHAPAMWVMMLAPKLRLEFGAKIRVPNLGPKR